MHQGEISKRRGNSFFPLWVRERELRQRLLLGGSDAFYRRLYSSISPCHYWGGGKISRSGSGLSCLEFSPDGSLLVAGCEENSFLMFDPLPRKLIRTVHNTHKGCVTHVRFLDSRIFATGGSDDAVSLWDTRNLKSPFRTLLGRSKGIGNIEFSRRNDILITSGRDGIINLWDVKKWSKRGEFKNSTFMSNVLLRLRLNPDETKMIISTASGYLLIVHHLDLDTLPQDIDEFEQNMFGFSFLNQPESTLSENSTFISSPNRRRNRLELVADFPQADGFHVISALEIHPQGWSAFSRRAMTSGGHEWTCVHDIQENDISDAEGALRGGLKIKGLPCPNSMVVQFDRRVHERIPRLTHYIEEPSITEWFVESLSVSADGRLVCSPFDRGIRLLAFSPECSEQNVCWCGTRPRHLYELSTHTFHNDRVFCTKFSPRHSLIVSGCLDGKIVWYQPVM